MFFPPCSGFVFSYASIALLTVVIGLVTYARTPETVSRDALQWNLAALERHRDIIEARLSEIERPTASLVADQRVRALLSRSTPLQPPDYYRIREMFQYLPLGNHTNDLVADVILLFPEAGAFVSSRYALARSPSACPTGTGLPRRSPSKGPGSAS